MALQNQAVFGRFAKFYPQSGLMPPELDLLHSFRPRWHTISVLDLGVGAGRTAVSFSSIAKRYVGLDYSSQMIERCRQVLPEGPNVRLLCGDARNLSILGDEKFDLVLFAWNGIDYVSPSDRLRVLSEVRRVLRNNDSRFYFSAHSLSRLPFQRKPSSFDRQRPIQSVLNIGRSWKKHFRLQWANRGLDLPQAQREGFAVVQDGAHCFGLRTQYTLASHQVEQLRQCGLRLDKLCNPNAELVSPASPGKSLWLAYYCSPY